MSNELITADQSAPTPTQPPATGEIIPYIRPPHTSPVYTEDELRAKFTVESYTKRIYVIIPSYKTGKANYSQLTVLQYADKFIAYMQTLQSQVAKKITRQYKSNGKVSRTSLQQLLTCIGSIDELSFPEESRDVHDYRWYLDAIAEAKQLMELMNTEAERLREESHKGNIRWVDKFS